MLMVEDKKNGSSVQPGRRRFLSKVWVGLGLVALAEFVTGGIGFFISGRKIKGNNGSVEIIVAGDVADFPPGTVTFIHAGNCYLSRLENGGFLALSRKCTHLGCAVPWVPERNQFECPCHASVFDNTGNVIKSPASRALDLYYISLDRNHIQIDVSRPVKRTNFNADQLVFPGEIG